MVNRRGLSAVQKEKPEPHPGVAAALAAASTIPQGDDEDEAPHQPVVPGGSPEPAEDPEPAKDAEPEKPKRGRPKGAKNKPKDEAEPGPPEPSKRKKDAGGYFTCDLPVRLEPLERAKLADRMADAWGLVKQRRVALFEATQTHKELIKDATLKFEKLVDAVTKGAEPRPVKCQEIFDYENKLVLTVRLDLPHDDPGHTIERRPMSESELQYPLKTGEVAPDPDTDMETEAPEAGYEETEVPESDKREHPFAGPAGVVTCGECGLDRLHHRQ